MKTVMHLRASNFVGGPERQILRYCTAAESGSPRQMVASFTGGGEGEAWLTAARALGIEAHGVPGGGARDLGALRRLAALLRERQVGLLCTHGYRADLLGTLAARRCGIPVAWFLRGWTGENRKVRLYETADRRALRWANRVVCLSQRQTEGLPASVRPERVRVVVNAIEPLSGDRAQARRELEARLGRKMGDAPVLAMAGRLSPEKGASLFLQAAARVHAEFPHATFVLFGDGVLRPRLEAEAAALGLGAVSHFAGHVPDWTCLLPGVDLIVNPSWREQAPNVVLEAMAASVPVVATAVGSVAEIAGAESGAPAALRLVAPGNVEALARAAADLLRDPVERRVLGASGFQRIRQAYSPARQQAQLQSLYRELLPQAAPQPRPAPAAAESALEDNALPSVSVVLPVRNEVRHLGALLDQLLAQDYPAARLEIIVADGESDDGTTALVQDYVARWPGRVRWVANPGRRSSAGRNAGLAAARGAWVVFVDGHCQLPGPAWLRDSMRAAGQHGALCLSRPQPLTAHLGEGLRAVIARARATRIAHGADSTIYDPAARGWVNPSSSGAAYHRSLFFWSGVYDESFDACEDVELNHRLAQAGLRAWLAPEAVVYYAARSDLRGLWRQMVRYGRGRVRLARKHRDAFSLPQCVPALWLAGLPAALLLLGLDHGLLRWLAAAGLGLYAALVFAYSLALGWRYGWRHLAVAPWVYFTVHAGLGAGAWREAAALLGRGRATSMSASMSATRSSS